jgi:hypothetical protein
MAPTPVPVRMYGRRADLAPLDWSWVEQQLVAAGTYWVVTRSPGHPHPRPVWGVWLADELLLSIGSVILGRELAADHRVTVHLDSGTDVVVVEGRAAGVVTVPNAVDAFLEVYNPKYEWNYTIEEYGPPMRIVPTTVVAWRSAGWAGREGFQQAGKWSFE